jgi:tetratricopeptide (TPR) repeat protein
MDLARGMKISFMKNNLSKKIIMKKNLALLSLLSFVLLSAGLFAQNDNQQYQEALKLKNENKFDESLMIFNQLLKNDSTNTDYFCSAAYLLCKLGNRQKTEEARQDYFRKAEYFSKKAIALDNKNPEAHYNYALALGRISEFASSKQKIANAKLIKTEAVTAIKLNPKHAGAYHILGRWHSSVAGFNMVEKAMINTFFGGVPEGGSYDDAIEAFKKAAQFEPNYMLHKYELALNYYERDKKDDYVYAKIWCGKILEMIPKDVDDKATQEKAKALLKKID